MLTSIKSFNTPIIAIGKASRLGTLISTTALAVGCASTPPSSNYASPANRAPVVSNYPNNLATTAPTIISKQHTHNGPLGDKICTFVFSNQERVLMLCDFKSPITSEIYSKYIPGGYVQIPSTTQWTPPTSKYEPPKWGYGYNPTTRKYEHHMMQGGIKTIPGQYKTIPGKTEYRNSKNVSCQTVQHFSQQNGAAMPKQEVCNK